MANGVQRAVRILGVFVLLGRAYGLPLSLQLTIDDLLHGRAVMSGDILDTPFVTDENICKPEVTPNCTQATVVGNNWAFQATLYSQRAFGGNTFYALKVEARHLTAPHRGEAAPNNLSLVTYTFNLSGAPVGAMPNQDEFASVIHPGSNSHNDELRTHIDDLNGTLPGLLRSGPSQRELSARFDTIHINNAPEPPTLLLLGTGLAMVGIVRWTWKSRER